MFSSMMTSQLVSSLSRHCRTKFIPRYYATSRSQRCSRHFSSAPKSKTQQTSRKWPIVASVMVVPGMFLAWGASDSIFGNRQVGKNEELREAFLSQYSSGLELLPVVRLCVVRRNTGFTHCLSGVQIGDVVEVLQEGVGPERSYNLCRVPANPEDPMSTDIYGWFPTRWLQKLDNYDQMVHDQLKQSDKTN